MIPAQERITSHQAHGWYNYFGDHAFGDSKWGVHLEGQWRRHDVITKGQQLLLRPGVNYTVNDWLMLTVGYAFADTFRYGEYPAARFRFPEHRIWEQALFRYRTGNIAWLTRIRFENRFLGVVNPETRSVDSYRYENRLRMLQQIRVPITQRQYFTAYDEFWVYVKPYVSSSAFDQNRAYVALGHQFNDRWRFEAGYMNQAILQRSGSVLESNHTLMLSILTDQPFRRRRR